MEVYSPNLVAIDKGQKYARPVMLSRPLGSRVSSQVQFKIKPLTIHLGILLVKIGKLIINFGLILCLLATGEVYMASGARG